MSMVKIVAVELSIDASEETIAAINAATTKPLMPVGMNVLISQDGRDQLIVPSAFKKVDCTPSIMLVPAGCMYIT